MNQRVPALARGSIHWGNPEAERFPSVEQALDYHLVLKLLFWTEGAQALSSEAAICKAGNDEGSGSLGKQVTVKLRAKGRYAVLWSPGWPVSVPSDVPL